MHFQATFYKQDEIFVNAVKPMNKLTTQGTEFFCQIFKDVDYANVKMYSTIICLFRIKNVNAQQMCPL